MSAPLMLLHASIAATNISDLRTHHSRSLVATVKRLKSQPSKLCFISSSENDSRSFILDVITDGTIVAAGETKGQVGHIIFCPLVNIVHPIHWLSRQLRRVLRSSSKAEILPTADAMSNGLYIEAILNNINICHEIRLTMDSNALAFYVPVTMTEQIFLALHDNNIARIQDGECTTAI